MIQRAWPAVALIIGLGIGPMPGCGMAVRKNDEESLTAATTFHSSFPEPPHRVALAAFEAMRADLASAEFAGDSQFAPDPGLVKPDGSKAREGELPANYPGFWLDWKAEGKPVRAMVTLKAARFVGKAADGRKVEVGVVADSGATTLTIRFDKLGDRMFSIDLRGKVAQRLAHPTDPPGSLEEAATLKAFFGGVDSREALPSLRKAVKPPA